MIPNYSAELNLLAPKTGLNGKPFSRIFVIVVLLDFDIPAQMIGKIPAVKKHQNEILSIFNLPPFSLKPAQLFRDQYIQVPLHGTPRAKRTSFFPLSFECCLKRDSIA